MRVSVFGGSQPREGDEAYTEAQALGRLLAERGHTVLTGGYIGTMEAVSRGANKAGGHVIGVTCADIERWRPRAANQWVKEEIKSTLLGDKKSEAWIKWIDDQKKTMGVTYADGWQPAPTTTTSTSAPTATTSGAGETTTTAAPAATTTTAGATITTAAPTTTVSSTP
jgi:hypothetical protein